MRYKIIAYAAFAMLSSCDRSEPTNAHDDLPKPKVDKVGATMLRSIRFYGTDNDFGIELNGSSAFVTIDSQVQSRIEIPYDKGLRLLEDFYAIKRIEEYRGRASDDRQSSIHYLVNIFDMKPDHYSEDWVDYVIPKDRVPQQADLNAWFEAMRETKEEAEQAATSNP